MNYFLILTFLIGNHNSFGQEKHLLQQKRYFNQELKLWTNSFNNFNLADFKVEDSLQFNNNLPKDFRAYKKFLSTYKSIMTYLPDSSKFIDIYSYQLNLEQKGNYYEANPDIDQAIFLCNPKTKYWNSIYFGTSSQWIDEVTWISATRFILVGIIKSSGDKKQPLILLGDIEKQQLIKYVAGNKQCFQKDKGYSSPKLKNISIRGL